MHTGHLPLTQLHLTVSRRLACSFCTSPDYADVGDVHGRASAPEEVAALAHRVQQDHLQAAAKTQMRGRVRQTVPEASCCLLTCQSG